MIDKEFWKDKKVFLTGHTGFKGSWLSLWLHMMGAKVTGYSLDPPTEPSLFEKAGVDKLLSHNIGDIKDLAGLKRCMIIADPEIVIHMAAQPLVRESYIDPVGTYQTNVMGTVNLFESVRSCPNIRAVVNVTTDKCYENKEWLWGYRENEPMGGYDPYSNSKGCSELVTSSYRSSFFNPDKYGIDHHVAIATARAGNVIGGGDWAKDRLIPDIIKSLSNKELVIIRRPEAVRPWQHVLEPLSGYLTLAKKLYCEGGIQYGSAWNFGPENTDVKNVEWIVSSLCQQWKGDAEFKIIKDTEYHESTILKLDISKANSLLSWFPRWNIGICLEKILNWYNGDGSVIDKTIAQINEYEM